MDVSRYVEKLKTDMINIDDKKMLLQFITEQLTPKQMEKKEFGEVFTPLYIVEEMLHTLPKEVWTNPRLTFLEPGSGLGNFSICVFYRLMDGLKTAIPDSAKRERHIIENMLYMAECNKANVHICKGIFKATKSGYKINLYQGDFLKLNPSEDRKKDEGETWPENWPKQFNIIVGNPPYNSGGIKSHTGKQLGEKNETIWPDFIVKSFDLLKPDGYLVFINPLSWLKKSHSLHNVMLEKHIIWMKLWDNSQSKGMINADIPISLYVLQNSLNTDKKKTEITSILKRRNLITTSNEYLNKDYSIPLAYHSIFNKLINFIETNNLKLEYSTKTVRSTGEKTKIPSKYKLEDMLAIDTYTIKEGIMIKKASETHPDANKRKLIIANKASFNGAFIDEGKLSLTGNHKFYVIGDRLELIMKMLSYKIIDIISHYTKYGQDFLDNEAFTYLPDIRKLGIKDITEDKFYILIGLTTEDINQIKNMSLKNDESEEIASLKNSKTTYANVVKTPAKILIRVDKLKQSAGYSQSTSIKQETDKLQYILQNVHKIDIKYKMFEKKLIEIGVNIDYIPKLWKKYYLQLKN